MKFSDEVIRDLAAVDNNLSDKGWLWETGYYFRNGLRPGNWNDITRYLLAKRAVSGDVRAAAAFGEMCDGAAEHPWTTKFHGVATKFSRCRTYSEVYTTKELILFTLCKCEDARIRSTMRLVYRATKGDEEAIEWCLNNGYDVEKPKKQMIRPIKDVRFVVLDKDAKKKDRLDALHILDAFRLSGLSEKDWINACKTNWEEKPDWSPPASYTTDSLKRQVSEWPQGSIRNAGYRELGLRLAKEARVLFEGTDEEWLRGETAANLNQYIDGRPKIWTSSTKAIVRCCDDYKGSPGQVIHRRELALRAVSGDAEAQEFFKRKEKSPSPEAKKILIELNDRVNFDLARRLAGVDMSANEHPEWTTSYLLMAGKYLNKHGRYELARRAVAGDRDAMAWFGEIFDREKRPKWADQDTRFCYWKAPTNVVEVHANEEEALSYNDDFWMFVHKCRLVHRKRAKPVIPDHAKETETVKPATLKEGKRIERVVYEATKPGSIIPTTAPKAQKGSIMKTLAKFAALTVAITALNQVPIFSWIAPTGERYESELFEDVAYCDNAACDHVSVMERYFITGRLKADIKDGTLCRYCGLGHMRHALGKLTRVDSWGRDPVVGLELAPAHRAKQEVAE